MAYKELYETYSEYMYTAALRYVADKDVAYDVLHDSFIKAIEGMGGFQFKGSGSLRAWLTKIAVNTALRHIRNTKNIDYADRMEDFETPADEFDESIYDLVTNDQIMQFVLELPTGYRTVFNLYMFENMSHAEISKMLGIKEVASRVRLTRAKSILAEKIKSYAGK